MRVGVDTADVDYLLAAANRLSEDRMDADDVVGSYAGVRVMKQSDAEHPSDVSRDWELKTAANGLHFAIGGKLTSAREDAMLLVDTVCARLGVAQACATKAHALPWKPEQDYVAWSVELSAAAQGLGIDAECALWLLRRHGVRAELVLRLVEADSGLAARIVPEVPFIRADLLLCARDEMAVHLDDLLRRRMPLSILAQLTPVLVRELAELVAPELGWDALRTAREVEAWHV